MTTLTITTSTITSTTASTPSLVTSTPYPAMFLPGPRPQFRQQNQSNLLQFNNSVVSVSNANDSSQMSNLQETFKQLQRTTKNPLIKVQLLNLTLDVNIN